MPDNRFDSVQHEASNVRLAMIEDHQNRHSVLTQSNLCQFLQQTKFRWQRTFQTIKLRQETDDAVGGIASNAKPVTSTKVGISPSKVQIPSVASTCFIKRIQDKTFHPQATVGNVIWFPVVPLHNLIQHVSLQLSGREVIPEKG